MGADGTAVSNTAVTLETFLMTAAAHQQYVRLAKVSVTPTNPTSWTVTTTGLVNVLPVDVNRVGLILCSYATARVYIRFDLTTPTIPTPTINTLFIDPGERYTVESQWVPCAVSLQGAAAGGFISLSPGTDP